MFFCFSSEESFKSTERIFDEFSVHKNALRGYAVHYAKFEEISSDSGPWQPVFEGHLVKNMYCNKAGLKCFVENTHDMHWIAVQGTETPETVLVEKELVWSSECGIYMHEGVKKVADDVYDTVAAQLDKAKAIRLTGHSIAGAAVMAVGHRLKKEGHTVESVASFGSPKFTDSSGAKKIAASIGSVALRVTYAEDPVPTLPPASVDFGWIFSNTYTHGSSQELKLSPGTKRMEYSATGMVEDAETKLKAESTWTNVTWLASDEQTRMITYLKGMAPAVTTKTQFTDMFRALTSA